MSALVVILLSIFITDSFLSTDELCAGLNPTLAGFFTPTFSLYNSMYN